MTRSGMERVVALAEAGLPVFVVGASQLTPYCRADLDDPRAWAKAKEALLGVAQVVEDYGELLGALGAAGILPDASYLDERVLSAHVRRGDEDLYLLYNGNRTGADEQRRISRETIMPAILGGGAFCRAELDVELSGRGAPYLSDLASGAEYALSGEPTERGVRLRIPLDGDQMVVVGLRTGELGLPARTLSGGHAERLDGWSLRLFRLRPSEDPCDMLAGGFEGLASVEQMPSPCPFDEVDGCPEDFAGYGEYRCRFEVAGEPREAYLCLPAWSDALELDVNGRHVPVVAGLGHEVDVRQAIGVGENDVAIRVYTNLSNALDTGAHQRYGLFGDVWVRAR